MVVTCSYPFNKYFKWWCFIDFPVRYVSLPEGSNTGFLQAPSDKGAAQNAGDQFTNGAPLGCQQSSTHCFKGISTNICRKTSKREEQKPIVFLQIFLPIRWIMIAHVPKMPPLRYFSQLADVLQRDDSHLVIGNPQILGVGQFLDS